MAYTAPIGKRDTAPRQRGANRSLAATAFGKTMGVKLAVGVAPAIDDILTLEVFAADGAALSKQLPIVIFAVGFALFLEVAALADQLAAGRATHAEQLLVIALAVGIAIAFEEASARKRLLAARANEMLWVPGFAQGRGIGAGDRLAAASAARAEALVVASGVVGSAVLRVKVLLANGTAAAGAAEAVRMPGTVEGRDVLASDGLAAAMTSGHRVSSS